MKLASRIVVVLAFCVGSFATETQAASSGPSPELSKSGRILRQFEALLHDSFGDHAVCASGRWGQKFTSGQCSPHAVYSRYSYVFARVRGSSLHTSSKKRVGGFGNYPVAVPIRGHPIACNARETQFLVKYRNAVPLALGCLRAGYITD